MVSDAIQHVCIKVLEEISMQKAVQKYQTTIGLKFTTHQSKHLRKARVVT
jgi:hypothetical protein